jgi:LmbE family N-acetylglucosaminyl deacetylase
VLVLAPHPDDETLACGGTILRHLHAGDAVRVVMVTDGRASRAGGLDPYAMAGVRQREAHAAMAVLGAELDWLGLPEAAWSDADLRAPLAAALAVADLVYAPSPVDYHPEHLRTARVLASLVDRQPVRAYELGVPLGPTLTSLVVDTGAVEGTRRAALAAYASQQQGIRNLRRLRRYAGAWWLGHGLAEPFWELSPSAYRAVVAAAAWCGGMAPTPFRGFRARAFGDPLSYLAGQSERRRLVAVAAAFQHSR